MSNARLVDSAGSSAAARAEPPLKRTRVLVVNGYSARNRGDGMIISQMIDGFDRCGAATRVMTDDPEDQDRYAAERIAPLVPSWDGERRFSSRAGTAAELVRAWLRPRDLSGSMSWADVCVSAGGGYLYDDGSLSSRINLIQRLLPIRAAFRESVPVVAFSQSIGPFKSRLWERLVASHLRRANLVIVREAISASVCERMGLRNVETCDDIAFALEPLSSKAGRHAGAVGVTVMSSLPGVDDAGHAAYARALRDGLLGALTGRNQHVVVISQVSAHAADSDVAMAQAFAQDLRARGLTAGFIDLADRTDDRVAAFYGTLKLVVASRLHSAILSICAGTPAIALSYLPKTDGVFDRAGFADMVLPTVGLSADRLAEKIGYALDGMDALEERVSTALPELRVSARRAIDLSLDAASARRS